MLKVIKFSADWCGPCRALKPVWEKIVSGTKDVEFEAINIDVDSEKATQFKIQAIPTLVFLKDGVEVDRMLGLVKEKEILDTINKLK